MRAKELIIMSILAAYIFPHPPIVIPEIGHGEEKDISSTTEGYMECARRIAAEKPDTILIISPHATIYSDYFHISPGKSAYGDFSDFRAGDVSFDVDYDEELVSAISGKAEKSGIPAGTLGQRDASLDHGTLIPIYFISKEYKDFKVVRMGFSGLPAITQYRMGQCIAEAANSLGRKLVVIASGDLSHKLKDDGPYGFNAQGPVFDKMITGIMSSGDFSAFLDMPAAVSEPAAECGLRSFQIMSGILDRLAVKPEMISYEGPFGVGYGIGSFEVTGPDPSRNFGDQYISQDEKRREDIRGHESDIVKLARYTVENFVKNGAVPDEPEDVPSELKKEKAGAFVSLHKFDGLRGCIGTFLPTRSDLASEIMHNAVSACSEDPRFEAVREDELDDLVYSVDILSAPEHIDSKDELDPKTYGVIVTNGSRRGLLLPDLEGVDTVDAQISIAKAKAGIGEETPVDLERFKVVRWK
jgi:AmmeMemoRadiSam system protein A/AmmeMemoRadiSam system protein B